MHKYLSRRRLTQHHQRIAHKTSYTDEREQHEHRPRNGAFKFMIEYKGLVVPMEIVCEVATHFAKHVSMNFLSLFKIVVLLYICLNLCEINI